MFKFSLFSNNQLAVTAYKIKIKITIILVLLSFTFSCIYTLGYFFILDNPTIAIINGLLALAIGFTLVFLYFNAVNPARVWFILVLSIEFWICTNVYFTKETGIHLMLFTVPIAIFLIFELRQYKFKIPLIFVSLLLLIQSENYLNASPMATLNEEQNQLFYQIVIYAIMLIIIFTIHVFSQLMAKNEENLIKQATIDNLTKLAHRNYFIDKSRKILALAIKQQRPFAMMIINIDNLKEINETFGYLVGDELLKKISTNISSVFDKSAIVARFGGKEFIVALPECTIEETKKKAQKVNMALAELNNFDNKWQTFRCSASIGIAVKDTDNPDIKELIAKANTAVHLAKSKGAGRISEYSFAKLEQA